MGKYVLGRVLLMIPVLLAFLRNIRDYVLDTGDPATILLGEGATPDQVAAPNKGVRV